MPKEQSQCSQSTFCVVCQQVSCSQFDHIDFTWYMNLVVAKHTVDSQWLSDRASQLLMLWFFGLKPRWDSYKFWRSNTQVISSQCWPSPCSASKLFVCILNLEAFKPSTSICIFSILFSIHSLRGWEGEFVQQSRVSLFNWWSFPNYSCGPKVWFRGYIIGRNEMLISHGHHSG